MIATSVGADPSATLRVPGTELQGSFGIGDSIPTVGVIDRIGWVSVDFVDPAGHHGRITLLDALAASRGGAGAATPDAAAAADPWVDRIKKIDDYTYEVQRDLVRELVGGSMKAGGARISPVTENGKLVGLKLFGASTNSLPAAIGLKNADVLSSVNNTEIKGANTLLDLYAQIDQLNVVELGGTRGGKPLGIKLLLRN